MSSEFDEGAVQEIFTESGSRPVSIRVVTADIWLGAAEAATVEMDDHAPHPKALDAATRN
jgi:hypothetical protein